MKQARIDFILELMLVLFLGVTVGCKQKTAVEQPRINETPTNLSLKNNDVKVNEAIRNLPANRQADLMSQQMRLPPTPQPVNPALNVQRSLQTVEEINRMNRLNQQLRENQPQKR